MLNYQQALKYLESFINYEKLAAPYDPRKWKLERMHHLLEAVGNPHKSIKSIHIAGTKGKGSTAVMIASILKAVGFRVGLYTSPHLISFRERIRIDNEMISEEQVCEMVSLLIPYIEEAKKLSDEIGNLSFFDIYTALGFLFFDQQDVDFAILEVGLGGRLDATNVVNPLVSVITQISYDHMLSLGNTIEAIAAEKAGIIKDNGIVITSPQLPEAMNVVIKVCELKNATLFQVGKDITMYHHDKGFSVEGISDKYDNLTMPLIGKHQRINASTAIGAVEALKFNGFNISGDSIRSGLSSVKWPARVEVMSENPAIILDVAHNEASAKALRETIQNNFKYEKLILILGVSMHKDVKGIGRQLCPVSDHVILTRVNNPRAIKPVELQNELAGICDDVIIMDDTASALDHASSIASKDDLICLTGSVYLAGEAMEILGRKS
ncbi:bifunctional folylpolyglutamate synthase/dihydrofolate synthase [Candidatus Poribacteria bacterium]|nr:bifunctional folylpolyglutamate synthase/dihydrofolate synthase [Candidatus Poribacteria bacterium]